jgi:hypothetical protein
MHCDMSSQMYNKHKMSGGKVNKKRKKKKTDALQTR